MAALEASVAAAKDGSDTASRQEVAGEEEVGLIG